MILVETARSSVPGRPWWHIVFQSIACKVSTCFTSFKIYFQVAFLIQTLPKLNRSGGLAVCQYYKAADDEGTIDSRGCGNNSMTRLKKRYHTPAPRDLLFMWLEAPLWYYYLFHALDFTY
jgi:hypothetical protein